MNKVAEEREDICPSEFLIRREQLGSVLYTQWQMRASIHRALPALEQLLALVRREQTGAWLLNLEDMPDLLMLDPQWLEYYYLPRVVALPLRHLALVLRSPWQHQTLLDARGLPPAFEVQIFDDATAALDWLRQVAGSQEGYQDSGLAPDQWAASA
ncbi:hypothetical protein KLP40_08115 [Hymenobacter sp. NST-14]|uniref:STAS/SEC14 domain-containing protein n=1 Tax=Hymenobacter piscis TaxID=2839984 RepID=UPI001C0318AA|nr:STAS/SEC14 domain-containing protein [Hymenobacter piscis]MBT9393126.1 hypothetical protein [Hymenobacter piscis]